MGRLQVDTRLDPDHVRLYTKSLLLDLSALGSMLEEGMFETGVRRIGAEQELFLVNRGWRPAPIAMKVLDGLSRPEFTPEIALYNLEINLPPMALSPGCFRHLEEEVHALVGDVREEARAHDAEVVLTGILPSLTVSDLALENLTPLERYHMLNKATNRMSGGSYRLHIQGADELHFEHDSVMLEGCNTSFQVHLQTSPEEMPRLYNIAQVLAAPVLAATVNSPLLFGRRLWAETRIALFQQAIDTRRTSAHLRELTPRVRFGERWVKESVLEVFHEDVARIPALFGATDWEDPHRRLRRGEIPELPALQMYNGTVYRWNRPCYGVTDGKPHLRLECRFLTAGPTILDEVANAALWIGSLLGALHEYEDVTRLIQFNDARANFNAAARRGLTAGFVWLNGEMVSAPRLMLERILPMARAGLESAGVNGADIDRYLGVIEGRVKSGRTGARWLLDSLRDLGLSSSRAERMAALTASIVHRQHDGLPGHEWEPARIEESGGWQYNYARVEQFMTTDLFTVKEDELVDLAALVMDFKKVRQVPVEDDQRRLVGLLSYGAVLRQLCAGSAGEDQKVPVKAIMDRNPLTVAPETPTLEAIRFMREHELSSCPVVKDGELVGIVSVGDFTPIAERLLEEKLAEAGSRTRQHTAEKPARRPSESGTPLRNGSVNTRLF